MAMRSEAKRCMEHFKAEYSDTVCRVGEVLLSFASGILTVVTFGTSYWLLTSSPDQSTHLGLWQECIPDTGACTTLGISVQSYLIAARFFMCFALVSGMCAWIISIIGLLQHKPRWLFSATVSYAIQALCMILGLSSFAKGFSYSTPKKSFSPAWSYSVGWLATVLAILCAVYFFSVAMYRYRNPAPSSYPAETRSYAPLAQFESTETGSDDDEEL